MTVLEMSEPLDFEKLGKIGEGQYGVVYKARMITNNKMVALKRISIDERDGIPSTALREISLLQNLKHDNIVKLHDVLHVDDRFYLVFELLEMDLGSLIKKTRPNLLPTAMSRSFFKQLITGLFFCHTRRILHRDIKPQNLLIGSDGVLKIADFGLARVFQIPLRPLTNEVVTMWYRPPEVLFGDDFYSMGVDVWSSGCILAELLMGKVLFEGDSEIGQIHEIFKNLGTPDEESWPGISRNPIFRTSFPDWERKPTEQLFPGVEESAASLLDLIFVYNQEHRLSTKAILECCYVSDALDRYPLDVKLESKASTTH